MPNTIYIRNLGLIDYESCIDQMQDFVKQRTRETADEIWLLQHPAVFTQGISGKQDNILDVPDRDYSVPVVQSSRGGQVTYHGSGQLVAYILIDMRRHQIGVRELVARVEKAIINTLAIWGIDSKNNPDAPGVYVQGEKIAALGLRVSRAYSYHGLSLNIDMDLRPFQWINPCGYPQLSVTQIADQLTPVVAHATDNEITAESVRMPAWQDVENALVDALASQLNSTYLFEYPSHD